MVSCIPLDTQVLGKRTTRLLIVFAEHGMLGDDSEGKHIAKANKISFHYVNTPTQIERYCEKVKLGTAVAVLG